MSPATSCRDVKRRLAAAALLAATIWLPTVASPPAAQAAVCTAWSSTSTPPPTIRVLRVSTGVVDTVDFMTYVKVVMPAEWPWPWPQEVLGGGTGASKRAPVLLREDGGGRARTGGLLGRQGRQQRPDLPARGEAAGGKP